MSRKTWAAGAMALGLIALAGCADNPMLQSRVADYQRQQSALKNLNDECQSRLVAADAQNQQMKTQLAQQQQQTKVAEEHLAAVRDQLRSTSEQLTKVQNEKRQSDDSARTLTASLHRQGGVSITPNNSFLQTALPVIHYPDVRVRRDGDVIRIALPADQLFEPGTVRVRPAAMNMIADVAIEIRRTYPDQLLGIEGHTDSDPVTGGYRTNHELSVQRALAVYEVLVSSQRYRPEQLFLVGHGANHPAASNRTPEGKQWNRRVELVIYPERLGQQGRPD
jgi:flagellar motor protein MotB